MGEYAECLTEDELINILEDERDFTDEERMLMDREYNERKEQ